MKNKMKIKNCVCMFVGAYAEFNIVVIHRTYEKHKDPNKLKSVGK